MQGSVTTEDKTPSVDLYNVMEYSGIDAYGFYLHSIDQKYLCVINERSH